MNLMPYLFSTHCHYGDIRIRLPTILSIVLLCILLTLSPIISAKTMEDIKERGYLIVGVKADYQPYGYEDADGNLTGLEISLARDIADRLGVDIKFIRVKSSNRMRFITQGQVDLLIATLSDRLERRRVVNIVEPSYYSSGTNLLAWKSAKLHSWEQLHRQKVCGIRGAFYNHTTRMDFGAIMVVFDHTDDALLALRQGRCLAFVYDDSFINHQLENDAWQKHFEMPLTSIKQTPWGLAIKLGEDDFKQYLKRIIIDWHQTGFIIQLEKNYGIKTNPFTLKMFNLYK